MKALMVGGPMDFKTMRIPDGQHEVLFPLPLTATWAAPFDPKDPSPMDIKVARYRLAKPISAPDYPDGSQGLPAGYTYHYVGDR